MILLKIFKFILSSSPVVILRLVLSLVIFKILANEGIDYFTTFNRNVTLLNLITLGTTLQVGKLIGQEREVSEDKLKTYLSLPVLSTTVVSLTSVIISIFTKNYILFVIALTSPLILYSHTLQALNNIKLEYQKNNKILIYQYLLLFTCVLIFLVVNFQFETFSTLYFLLFSLTPSVLFYRSSKILFSSLYDRNKLIKSRFSIDIIKNYIVNNLVYLNPLLVYFLYSNLLKGINPEYSVKFEINYRVYSMLFSLFSMYMISFAIPSLKNKLLSLNNLAIQIVIIITVIPIVFMAYNYYILGAISFHKVDIIFFSYFIYKLIEFVVLSLKLSEKKLKYTVTYIFDVMIYSIICWYY